MIKSILLLVNLLLISISLYSQPLSISSEQTGVFDSAEYVAKEDVIVPEKQKLKIRPGSQLYFYPGAGIRVSGKLICRGTRKRPIIFNSINNLADSLADNNLQWDGIQVLRPGRISFKHCKIYNSLYGVSVSDTACLIQFDSVSFYQNDNSFIINQEPVFSTDSTFYSFPIPLAESVKTRKYKSPFLPILRYSLLACSIGSIAGMLYCRSEAYKYNDKYNAAGTPSEMTEFETERDKFRSLYNASLAGAAVFIPCFILTFAIQKPFLNRKN